MKKTAVIILSALFLASICAVIVPAFAKDQQKAGDEVKVDVVKGKIVSIDAAKELIVIQQADGTQKSVKVTAEELKGLKADEEVRAKLTA